MKFIENSACTHLATKDSFYSHNTHVCTYSLSESINVHGTQVIPTATTSLPAICRKVWLPVPLLLKAYFFPSRYNHSAIWYNHHQIPLFGSECIQRTREFDFLRAMAWDYMEHTSTSYTIIRQPFHPPPLVHHQQECSTGVHCTAASTESSNAALGLCTSQTTLPAQHVHAHTYCWLCSNSTNRHVVWTGNASLEQRIDGFGSQANWSSADSSKHVIGRDRGAQDSQQGRLIRFIGQLPWCSNTDTPPYYPIQWMWGTINSWPATGVVLDASYTSTWRIASVWTQFTIGASVCVWNFRHAWNT